MRTLATYCSAVPRFPGSVAFLGKSSSTLGMTDLSNCKVKFQIQKGQVRSLNLKWQQQQHLEHDRLEQLQGLKFQIRKKGQVRSLNIKMPVSKEPQEIQSRRSGLEERRECDTVCGFVWPLSDTTLLSLCV
jgi:hypothetical protein